MVKAVVISEGDGDGGDGGSDGGDSDGNGDGGGAGDGGDGQYCDAGACGDHGASLRVPKRLSRPPIRASP